MINWAKIAMSSGYSTPKEMLVDLYYMKGLSLRDMGDYLAVNWMTLRAKMASLGLPVRERGGANNVKSGPPCPNCGHAGSKVITSYPKSDGQVRKRRCNSCSTLFTTKEIVAWRQKQQSRPSS